MKAGWDTRTLGEVCNVEYGTRVVQKRDGGKGYPVYGGGGATFEMDTFNRENRMVIARFAMSEKCTRFVEGKFFLNDSGLTISPKDESLNHKFLSYQILALNNTIYALGKGTAQKNLEVPAFRNLPLCVANTLSEQERIVSVLDQAFEHIATAKAAAQANLANAKALFESHLQAVFVNDAGELTPLGKLGKITSSKRIFQSEYVPEGVPFYRTKEIKQLANKLPLTTELFISKARYQEIKNKYDIPKTGDLLITAIGTIGEIWVVEDEQDFYFKDGNVVWLKGFNSLHPSFLRYALTAFVEDLKQMSRGSAYSALPIQKLVTHSINVPRLGEQIKASERLDEIQTQTRQLEALYQAKLSALDALKQSLLHQAFSGAL